MPVMSARRGMGPVVSRGRDRVCQLAWQRAGAAFPYLDPMARELERNVLGRRIADHRAKQGWTQADLAERLGVSRVTISHVEAGMSYPG